MVCHDEETQNWLSSNVSPLTVWEGSRLKMAGLEALSIHKRVVAWFPGSAEDTKRYFQRLRRLNQGLNTSQWGVYERKVEQTRSALCSASIHLPSLHPGDEVASVQRRGAGEILLSRR